MTHREHLERWVPDLKHRRVLDLGCGRGDILIDFIRHGYRAVGLDKNGEYLRTAKEDARRQGLSIDVREGDAEALPFENARFDFINCNEVTEHVESPEKLLNECARVLAQGGKMYISFHNRFGIYDYHYHLWGINWLPRRWADWLIRVLGKEKGDDEEAAGRQKLSRMQYVTWKGAAGLLEKSGFSWIDLRKEHLTHPEHLNHPLVNFIAALGLRPFAFWFIRAFFPTFHFLATKA